MIEGERERVEGVVNDVVDVGEVEGDWYGMWKEGVVLS